MGQTQAAIRQYLNNYDSTILGLQALGSPIKAVTLGSTFPGIGSNDVALSNQTPFYVATYLSKADTLTGVKLILSQAFVGTANNNNYVGLFTLSGTTLTRVAISTTNSNLWKSTANTLVSVPFSSTYSAAKGIYFVGLLYCESAQTNAPNLYVGINGLATSAISSMDFTSPICAFGQGGTSTTLPTTQVFSGITANSNPIWVSLY